LQPHRMGHVPQATGPSKTQDSERNESMCYVTGMLNLFNGPLIVR